MASFASVRIAVSDKLYERDPEQTQLGKKIINHSIRLIDQLGLEAFTFKKLAQRIQSTEASIYRYFKNKHHLLVYLVSWYWGWLEYQIEYKTNNIEDTHKKLQIAIETITKSYQEESGFSHINQASLHRIVIAESQKAYFIKNVDYENQKGFFRGYKSLCNILADLILEYNAEYPYSHSLASTLLESAHQQVYFSLHIPALTEVQVDEKNHEDVINYLEHLLFKQLG